MNNWNKKSLDYALYLKNRKTTWEPYTLNGFSWLIHFKKLSLEETYLKEKSKRGGMNSRTRAHIFTEREHYKILDLYNYWLKAYQISRRVGLWTWLVKKSLKHSGINIKYKIYATREEYNEYLKTARVKWNLWVYREFKKKGYSMAEIWEIDKKRSSFNKL